MMANSNHAAKRWCFTINNFTAAEQQAILDSSDNFDYLIVAREHGDSGTPHLQGFLILQTKLRLANVKALPGFSRAHLEKAKGTPKQASDYCKKDGDFDEFGQLPDAQGKRTDFESLKEWIKEQNPAPTHREIAEEYPSLWGRYKSACINFLDMFGLKPNLVSGELREWQQELNTMIDGEANDRHVWFVIDKDGNKGKSWLTRYWFCKRDDMQKLSIGKRDDLAYAIDASKRIYIFDVPRGQMEYLQYCVLEMLKDQMVFSPKYESMTKILSNKPHVIVFCNEDPDITKMSMDRYKLKYLN